VNSTGRFLTALLVILGCACSGDAPGGEEGRALEVLAAHRSPDIDALGEWGCPEQGVRLDVQGPEQPDGGMLVLTMSEGTTNVGRASLVDGVLELESSVAGATRFHFCRFGAEERLVAESPRFEVGDGPIPITGGLVLERVWQELDPMLGYQIPPGMETDPTQRGAGDD
jgi:hypothetical protein